MLDDGPRGGDNSASQIYECERNCGFENLDRGLVELHEQVCGRTFAVPEQVHESTQCVRNASCSKLKGHGGACKVAPRRAGGDDVAEDVAAIETEKQQSDAARGGTEGSGPGRPSAANKSDALTRPCTPCSGSTRMRDQPTGSRTHKVEDRCECKA